MNDERECTFSFDGKHHYAPRRWLVGSDPNYEGNWNTVLACRCRKYPPNPAEVREQLAIVARERARQRYLSKKMVEKAMEESGREWAKQQAKMNI